MKVYLDLKVLLRILREILAFEPTLFTCASKFKSFLINIPGQFFQEIFVHYYYNCSLCNYDRCFFSKMHYFELFIGK